MSKTHRTRLTNLINCKTFYHCAWYLAPQDEPLRESAHYRQEQCTFRRAYSDGCLRMTELRSCGPSWQTNWTCGNRLGTQSHANDRLSGVIATLIRRNMRSWTNTSEGKKRSQHKKLARLWPLISEISGSRRLQLKPNTTSFCQMFWAAHIF